MPRRRNSRRRREITVYIHVRANIKDMVTVELMRRQTVDSRAEDEEKPLSSAQIAVDNTVVKEPTPLNTPTGDKLEKEVFDGIELHGDEFF